MKKKIITLGYSVGMMEMFIMIILLHLLFGIPLNSFSQVKIDKSKEELKKGSRRDYPNRNQSSYSSSSDNNLFNNVIAEGVVQVFLFVTYYSIIGNYEAEAHLHSNLTRYPYYNRSSGNYESPDSITYSKQHLRLDLENKLILSPPDLFGNHLKARIRPFQFFYFQADYIQFIEFTNLERSRYSDLALFNFNICYDRIRFEKFNLGWTLGLNYIGNDVKKAGFSYGLNVDVFLFNPVSLFSSMKWSSINNLPVNEFEIQLKYHKKNYFFTLGYEHLKIATPTYNFISIGGGIYF